MSILRVSLALVCCAALCLGCSDERQAATSTGEPQGGTTASERTTANGSPAHQGFSDGTVAHELVLVEIEAGPLYNFGYPHTGGSGEGRWVLSDDDFTIWGPGAGYFDAKSRPLIAMGHPNARETMLWSRGTTHVIEGRHEVRSHVFHGDRAYPLVFKLVQDTGYVYVCGRGTVARPDGHTYRLGFQDDVNAWLGRSGSEDPLELEGVAFALGCLTKTPEDRDRVIPVLLRLLDFDSTSVAWTATEALGRVGDRRAVPRLRELAVQQKGSQWETLATESVQLIRGRLAANEYLIGRQASADSLVLFFTRSTELARGTLGGSFSFEYTRSDMVSRLGARAADFIAPVSRSLMDTSALTRMAAARSLTILDDMSALEALSRALHEESNERVRRALEHAIEKLDEE